MYKRQPDDSGLLRAIDFVHLHGRKLYLTVNTLLKEKELTKELWNYLAPLYEPVSYTHLDVYKRQMHWNLISWSSVKKARYLASANILQMKMIRHGMRCRSDSLLMNS